MRMPRSLGSAVVCLILLMGLSGCGRRLLPGGDTEPPSSPPSKPAARAGSQTAAKPQAGDKKVPAAAEEDAPRGDFNAVNLEVTALEMFYQLRLTRPQLERLARLAPVTAQEVPAARAAEVSAELRRKLAGLHSALADNDDERVAELSPAVEELRDKEGPEFDEVGITDAARKHTPEVMRQLSPRQVASYVSDYADEFPDPLRKVLDAFDDVRKLAGREWEEVRDDIAGQVGWLVAGLDTQAEARVSRQVADLLNRVKGLKDEEYKAKRAELEKQARAVVGNVGPTDVIRHFVERSLAELLSNPRLAAAAGARLRKGE
jgi:hypothetical protein